MRVTQLTTFNTLKRYLDDNREALAKYQQQLSSGQRVTKASDDSIAFTTSRLLKNDVRKNEQFQSNIENGLTKASASEDALNDMADVLIDLKGIAVNAASDSLNASDRENMATQVKALKEKIVDLGNTKFNGTYLFGGTKTGAPPFELDNSATGGVRYSGNDKTLQRKISGTSSVGIAVNGSDLRDTGSGDLFGMMQDMEDALRANDTDAVNSSIDTLTNAFDHITNKTAVLGINIDRMNSMNEQMDGQAINQEGEISRLIDTDFAEAISNVQKYETTYQAALSVHSSIIQTSLLNYL